MHLNEKGRGGVTPTPNYEMFIDYIFNDRYSYQEFIGMLKKRYKYQTETTRNTLRKAIWYECYWLKPFLDINRIDEDEKEQYLADIQEMLTDLGWERDVSVKNSKKAVKQYYVTCLLAEIGIKYEQETGETLYG